MSSWGCWIVTLVAALCAENPHISALTHDDGPTHEPPAGGDHGTQARDYSVLESEVMSCHPHLWRWDDVTDVRPENLTRAPYRRRNRQMKMWEVDFRRGNHNGGVTAMLKLRAFWAPKSDGVLVHTRSDNRVGIGRTRYKCPWFLPNSTSWAITDDPTQHLSPFCQTSNFDCSATGLLNEAIVHQVDALLGFRTVPPGKLVTIDKTLWANLFSSGFCGDKDAILHEAQRSRSEDAVYGWLQLKMPSLVMSPPGLSELGCAQGMPNKSTVMHVAESDRVLVSSFFEVLLVASIAGRSDQMSNCFAVPTHPKHSSNSFAACETIGFTGERLRAINLDNDRLMKKQNWATPCVVPAELRARVIAIGNFTHAFLHSIRTEYPFLSTDDLSYITMHTKTIMAPYFDTLAARFRKCDVEPKS